MSNRNNTLRKFAQFEIDVEKKVLWHEEVPLELPFKAIELLCFLIERQGEVVTKKDLLDAIWSDSFVEESVLPQNVYLLRKTFKEYGVEKDLIQTVPRRGYRFAGEVSEVYETEDEILIERETFERKFIAEAELSNGEILLNDQSVSSNLAEKETSAFASKSFLAVSALAGILLIALIGSLGVYWVYPKFFAGAAVDASENKSLKYERLTNSARAFYAGLSHDNQLVAYVIHTADNKYSIKLKHLATGSETVILKPQKLHPVSLQFAPDGNHIYFSARSEEKAFYVYRLPIFGGKMEAVAKNITHHFSISPDGVWLAYFISDSKNKESYTMICRSSDCSGKRIVSRRKHPDTYSLWGSSPSWSSDGRKLVASVYTNIKKGEKIVRKNHLVEIDVATGFEKNIKTPEWLATHQAYWTENDSALMVLARERRGVNTQIWRLKYPEGTVRNITNDTNEYREFRTASDSSFIIGVTWTKSDNLYTFPAENPANLRQLTFGTSVQNGVYGLEWTLDGKNLLYVSADGLGTGNLFKLNLETGENKQLTFDKNSFPNYIEPTLDGKSVIFASNRTGKWHVWQVDLDGDNLKQLTDGVGEVAPEISPDGKWLYYTTPGDRPNTLWKMPLAGGAPVKILKGVGGATRVSPSDPDKIASYYFDSKEKKKIPHKVVLFSEKNPNDLIDLEMPPAHRFEWKPDGTGIYYTFGGESFNNIWFVSIKDKQKKQITNFTDKRISNLDISPDGKTFAISRGASEGKIFKISGFTIN